jgi:prevent-host-death family protein
MQMNIAEAKAKLSELIAAAERGEEVVIARGGKPIVRLVSVQSKGPTFRIGIAEGEVTHIPDFIETMTDKEIALWS